MGLSDWFRGLKGRLLFLVVVPLVIFVVIGTSAILGMRSQGEVVHTLTDLHVPIQNEVGEMRVSTHAVGRFLLRAIATDETAADRSKSLTEVRTRMESFESALRNAQALPLPEKMKLSVPAIADAWKRYRATADTIVSVTEKGTPEALLQAKHMIPSLYEPGGVIAKGLNDIDKMSDDEIKRLSEESRALEKRVQNLVFWISVLGGVVLISLGLFVAIRLSESLSGLARTLGEAGTQVSSASGQLSASSQQLSSGATEAAASLEETVSSLEELTSMVTVNADNAKQAAALSAESQKSAVDGEAEIRRLIDAMRTTAQSSKKIEEIINVIDDIAFQTNLLALNAAVEAARAGEQGKGFAVVADAVRNLAQRSASAAKDITLLIKESVSQTEQGVKIADGSGEVLKKIVTSVKKVSDLNTEIASASAEQSNGLGQISKAMNQLDQATQSNAAAAEECAASAEEMNSQADMLQRTVVELNRIVTGQ